MTTICVSDLFKFMHRVMNLEMDETEYDDEPYDMAADEEEPYEDNEG